jgi:hypothetical protein
MEHFIEATGMVLSILGALLMSRDHHKHPDTMYYAFISFAVSNLALIYLSLVKGLLPMSIQMVLFLVIAMIVISSHSSHRQRDIIISILVSLVYFTILFFIIDIHSIDMTVKLVDVIAATIAIAGSFAMKTHNPQVKLYAFAAFFVADLLYTYIGLHNNMYFFTVQSVFFLYTSIAGARNTLKHI